MDAWDLVMRALSHYWRVSRQDNVVAQALLEKATEIDPGYGQAHGLLAASHTFSAHMGWADMTAVAPAAERAALVLGKTALPCVSIVAALSLPTLVAAFVALRSLAPTRLAAAGAAAGALAGGIGAAVYAWHCNEMTLPFVAVWYVLGMAIPAILGAVLARRWLHWS